MENIIPAEAAIEKCDACFTDVVADDVYCTNCGYPLKGSDFEQRSFIANRDVIDIDMNDFNNKIKSARNSLYYLAGVFMFVGVINFFIKKDDPDILAYVLVYVILAALFLALGGYSQKKPLACIVSGLCLYTIVQVLAIIDNPANLVSGIIVKIVIIGYMIKGIKSALELERFKKENNIT
ncbi:hypothetical protein [Mucilaginibacter segetis]|uniref:Zinc ribbon domain-containing protein n=1 Tax=Mucilaginibacter segetis TaxID=2793071 RepID=A0A934PUK8_9SPHI|nr:hypothetical protein [Mucilaginibacter segetis]MBK0381124.1 hypothetical protein [Mucilaginibacter segetis]